MGEVTILMNEEGVLKVVQHYDLRVLLRRLRPEGFERHRVVKWPSCKYSSTSAQEGRVLMVFFFLAVCLAVVNIIYSEYILQIGLYQQVSWKGIIPLVIFAAVVAVGVFVTNKTTASALPKRAEVQTISALVEKV